MKPVSAPVNGLKRPHGPLNFSLPHPGRHPPAAYPQQHYKVNIMVIIIFVIIIVIMVAIMLWPIHNYTASCHHHHSGLSPFDTFAEFEF